MRQLAITVEDYLGGHQKDMVVPDVVMQNAEFTVAKVNHLTSYLEHYGIRVEVNPRTGTVLNSGWRPPEYNASLPNAAPKSKHITGCAADIYDPEGEIDTFLMENMWLLKELDLYMEHASATKGWCHIQTVPPRSGKLVFFP